MKIYLKREVRPVASGTELFLVLLFLDEKQQDHFNAL